MSENKVDLKLLESLVCPLTKSTLRYNKETQELISSQAKLAFPIKNGIPLLVVEKARKIGE